MTHRVSPPLPGYVLWNPLRLSAGRGILPAKTAQHSTGLDRLLRKTAETVPAEGARSRC